MPQQLPQHSAAKRAEVAYQTVSSPVAVSNPSLTREPADGQPCGDGGAGAEAVAASVESALMSAAEKAKSTDAAWPSSFYF